MSTFCIKYASDTYQDQNNISTLNIRNKYIQQQVSLINNEI